MAGKPATVRRRVQMRHMASAAQSHVIHEVTKHMASLNRTAVKWLTQKCHYSEKFSDPNGGAGARCDSIGIIDGRPVLIEFKREVTSSMVPYSRNTGSSIERKIRNSLEALSSKRMLADWDKSSWPRIWIVAERISKPACEKLNEVLSRRSKDWCFVYEFGEWNGAEYVRQGKGPSDLPHVGKPWMFSGVPEMEWPGEHRLPRRNYDAFQKIAEKMGVRELFDKFMEKALGYGLKVKCNRDNLNLRASNPQSGTYMNVISVWPGDSGSNGLCVAEDVERLRLCFPNQKSNQTALPGIPAPHRGYMGQRRFLASDSEIASYWVWAIGT